MKCRPGNEASDGDPHAAIADFKLVIATTLPRLRYDRGWTPEDLADRVALSARYLGAIERGRALIYEIVAYGRDPG